MDEINSFMIIHVIFLHPRWPDKYYKLGIISCCLCRRCSVGGWIQEEGLAFSTRLVRSSFPRTCRYNGCEIG